MAFNITVVNTAKILRIPAARLMFPRFAMFRLLPRRYTCKLSKVMKHAATRKLISYAVV